MDDPKHPMSKLERFLNNIIGQLTVNLIPATWIRVGFYSILVVSFFLTGGFDLKEGTVCSEVESIFLSGTDDAPGWVYMLIALIPIFEITRILHNVSKNGVPHRRFVAIGSFILCVILCFSLIYIWLGISTDGFVAANPLDYLYFSTVTFTTLGYGDFAPCPNARWAAASQALIGFGSIGLLIYVATKRN